MTDTYQCVVHDGYLSMCGSWPILVNLWHMTDTCQCVAYFVSKHIAASYHNDIKRLYCAAGIHLPNAYA